MAMGSKKVVTRREFLKLAGINLAALVFPGRLWLTGGNIVSDAQRTADWPGLHLDELPSSAQEILKRVPKVELDDQGILRLLDEQENATGAVPLARTQWNLERSQPLDRLMTEWSWGLVVHWYGEPEGFDKTQEGYLRGFDGLRQVGDYETRTSAHFLVGDAPVVSAEQARPDQIGILQTQIPDADGIPYVASHLRPLNYELHRERKQYYVKALDALEYEQPAIHSMLQDFYDGPKIDPGWRTIAIEVAGKDFENPKTPPSPQKIANLLALIWAVMKRYQISALDILGHQEIELGKSDPGRGFMALLRYLLGIKALVDEDDQMKSLVFGRLMAGDRDVRRAVERYFRFVRDYLVLVSKPAEVYAWELQSKYWLARDLLEGRQHNRNTVESFGWPLEGEMPALGGNYLQPDYHEGVDLFANQKAKTALETPVSLVADGECLYAGRSQGHCPGKMAIFRHRQADGTLILTIYSHMSKLSSLKVGQVYPKGHQVGKLASPYPFMERYLHFAVAYGATWETDLRSRPSLPLEAKPEWIQQRYLPPLAYLGPRVMPAEQPGKLQSY